MASVNKVIMVGNLGRDPETRYMPDGAAITNASVATSFQWNDKASGEKKEETEWHRVVVPRQAGRDRRRIPEEGLAGLRRGPPAHAQMAGQGRPGQATPPRSSPTACRCSARARARGEPRGEPRGDAPPMESKAAESKPAAAKKPAGKFDDLEDDIPF